ncbi:hypothetical protein ACS0TY_019222 [Phlomoides rotata]
MIAAAVGHQAQQPEGLRRSPWAQVKTDRCQQTPSFLHASVSFDINRLLLLLLLRAFLRSVRPPVEVIASVERLLNQLRPLITPSLANYFWYSYIKSYRLYFPPSQPSSQTK